MLFRQKGDIDTVLYQFELLQWFEYKRKSHVNKYAKPKETIWQRGEKRFTQTHTLTYIYNRKVFGRAREFVEWAKQKKIDAKYLSVRNPFINIKIAIFARLRNFCFVLYFIFVRLFVHLVVSYRKWMWYGLEKWKFEPMRQLVKTWFQTLNDLQRMTKRMLKKGGNKKTEKKEFGTQKKNMPEGAPNSRTE